MFIPMFIFSYTAHNPAMLDYFNFLKVPSSLSFLHLDLSHSPLICTENYGIFFVWISPLKFFNFLWLSVVPIGALYISLKPKLPYYKNYFSTTIYCYLIKSSLTKCRMETLGGQEMWMQYWEKNVYGMVIALI